MSLDAGKPKHIIHHHLHNNLNWNKGSQLKMSIQFIATSETLEANLVHTRKWLVYHYICDNVCGTFLYIKHFTILLTWITEIRSTQ